LKLAVNGSSARILRKEKERLTAASLNNRFFIFLEVVSISSSLASTSSDDESKVCYNSLASLFVTPIKKETERELKRNPKRLKNRYVTFICYLLIFCSVKPKEIKELARRWRENPKGNKEKKIRYT